MQCDDKITTVRKQFSKTTQAKKEMFVWNIYKHNVRIFQITINDQHFAVRNSKENWPAKMGLTKSKTQTKMGVKIKRK